MAEDTPASRAAPVWRTALTYALTNGVPRRSFRIALIVGAVLNLINQGDALLGTGRVNWFKLGLTFAVPYLVSTYGVVSFRLSQDRLAALPETAKLIAGRRKTLPVCHKPTHPAGRGS